MYVLVCGSLPFDGPTLQALRNVVIEGKFRIPYFMSQDCEHLIRHMLVVEPERRLSLIQISKHRWLSNIIPVDTGPEKEQLQLNETVIDHMLQLPGLTQSMILQSLQNKTFDHIYAIYNLLLDKLHQRTVNFQTKLSQRRAAAAAASGGNNEQQQQSKKLEKFEIIGSFDDDEYSRAPRINERSESFNETLVTQLNNVCSNKSSDVSVYLFFFLADDYCVFKGEFQW